MRKNVLKIFTREQGVAGHLDHAGDEVGEPHHHHQGLEAVAEVDGGGRDDLEDGCDDEGLLSPDLLREKSRQEESEHSSGLTDAD